jgi:imidazole glycerol-phosphate synthase subunit HisH|tara:strand:- start:13901 stop:14515 length:615 start_codon:yes stop_codon:yes gene_type:complete
MKIAIINFNSGNLYSIKKSIKDLRHEPFICNDSNDLKKCDKIILPGVGSFNQAMKYLLKFGFVDAMNELVYEKGLDILGICLGMQLFCKSSNEQNYTKGLSFVEADVLELKNLGCELKLPHIGWNNVQFKKENKIFNGIENNSDFYFVHNFAVKCNDEKLVLTTTNYDVEFVSAFQKDNIYAVQFHPEKSSASGLKLIQNFLEI